MSGSEDQAAIYTTVDWACRSKPGRAVRMKSLLSKFVVPTVASRSLYPSSTVNSSAARAGEIGLLNTEHRRSLRKNRSLSCPGPFTRLRH